MISVNTRPRRNYQIISHFSNRTMASRNRAIVKSSEPVSLRQRTGDENKN